MATKKRKKVTKTTAKTTSEPTPVPSLVPQPHGGALNSGGTPGNKGGPGRPPKVFKMFCTDLTSDPEFQSQLERTAKDPGSQHYIGAVKLATAYSEGLPSQPIALKAEVTVNADDLRLEIASRLARKAVQGGHR
jgi:hypothetical protein